MRVENRSRVSAAGLVVRLAFDPETASLQGGNADAEIKPGLLEWQSIAVGGGDHWQRTVVLRLTQDFSAPVWLAATVEGEELYATRTAQQMVWTQDPPPVRVQVTPGMTQTLTALGGRVQVDFPAGAVSEPLRVQLRWSRPQAGDPPAVRERWELRAQNEKDEEQQRFTLPLRLTLQRRLRPEGVHVPAGAMAEPMQRPVFYGLDETSGHWQDLGGSYDPASGRLEVEIDHFGSFAAGETDGFGSLGLPSLRVAAASLFSANLEYGYSLAMPAGPHGFGPRLSLGYSDEVVNAAWDKDRTISESWMGAGYSGANHVYYTQASAVGYGWSIGGLGRITVNWECDTPPNGENCVMLSFGGGSYRLHYIDNVWRTDPESFLKVWRLDGGGNVLAAGNWVVMGQDGVKYTFGDGSGDGQGNGRAWFRQSNLPNCGWLVYAYYLVKVEDVYGNHWHVDYENENGLHNRDYCTGAIYTRAVHPKLVKVYQSGVANSLAEVEFVRELRNDTDVQERRDGLKQALYANERIKQIWVRSRHADGNLKDLFRYDLGYDYSHGTDANCASGHVCTHSLLKTITVTPLYTSSQIVSAPARTTSLAYSFYSGMAPPGVDVNFAAIYLGSVQNGRGGELYLHRQPNDEDGQTGEVRIAGHWRLRLRGARVGDGRGNYVWTTYKYAGSGFDKDEFGGFATVEAHEHGICSTNCDALPPHAAADVSGRAIYSFLQGNLDGVRSPDDAVRGRLWRRDQLQWTNDLVVYDRIVYTYTATDLNSVGWAKLGQTLWHVDKDQAGWDKHCETYDYDTALQGGSQHGLVTHLRQRPDYCDTAPYRTTITTYAIQDTAGVFLTRPQERKQFEGDANGVCKGQSRFYYDDQPLGALNGKGQLTQTSVQTAICNDASGWSDTTVTYWANGNQRRLTLPANHAGQQNWTETTWDGVHGAWPVTVVNNKGHATATTYDLALGVALSVSEPNGSHEYDYDGFGRLRKAWVEPQDRTTTPGTPTTVYVYNEGSVTPGGSTWYALEQRYDQAGETDYLNTWTFFDGLGRPIQTQTETEDANQAAISYQTYDANGQVAIASLPYFYAAGPGSFRAEDFSQPRRDYAYDGLGRVLTDTLKSGTQTVLTTKTRYQGYATASIDANGHLNIQTLDDWGRLAKSAQYTGVFAEPNWGALPAVSTVYGYDVADRLTTVTPFDENQQSEAPTHIGYDLAGRKQTLTDPDMGAWSYTYDAAGNLRTQTDARGCVTTFGYDELNRLAGKSYMGPADCATTAGVNYSYDAYDGVNQFGIGRRTGMVDGSGSTSWQYDRRGRLTRETKVIGATSFTTQWTYDAMDRVKTMTYPDTEVVTYDYNPQGLLEGMSSSLAAGIKYVESSAYDAMSRLTQRTMRNNPNATIDYAWTTDYAYHPWSATNGWGRLQSIVTDDLQSLTYAYDAVGNVKTIIDETNSSQRQCFNYDDLNRLTQGYTGVADCTSYEGATGDGAYEEQYSYFANGNLKYKKIVQPAYQHDDYLYDAPSPGGCTTGTPAAKPHAVRQAGVNTYSYDCNGNMTGRSIGATTPYTLSYNAENRLTQVQQSSTVQASFVYDGDGNRVQTTVGSVTTMYAGRHYEYVNSTTYTKYYHAGGDLIAFERSSGYGDTAGYGRRFVFRDHLNSTSLIVNGSNSTIARDLYRPYGDVRYQWRTGAPPIATQTQYRYTSQRLEVGVGAPSPVGGLDRGLYFYGARWYDASLAQFIQPDTIVPEPDNPQSLNRYSYTLNNPVRYADPSGHAECIYEDCNVVWHPTSGRVRVRSVGNSALYQLIAQVSRGNGSAKISLEQVLASTNSYLGNFHGVGGLLGDTGFQVEFRDDALYGRQWGFEQPASRQVGHFLTAVRMGYSQNEFKRLVWLYAIVGHEQQSDGRGGALQTLKATAQQVVTPSDVDVFHFRAAVEDDAAGSYALRDAGLWTILDPSQYGDLSQRIGNSMEDLRLSVRGWRLGTMVSKGEISTNQDLANWLALYVAGD